jgi:ribonuclease P protein component
LDPTEPSPRQTLRPTDRLKRREDFRRVQERGRKHHTKHFLVLVLPRGDEGPPRVGVTVTKKVGNAVQRNRVKRLVREVFRRNRDRFPSGCDVVWIAKDGAPELGYEEVLAELPARLTRPSAERSPKP